MTPRRIVALVLPKLACEIAKSRAEVKGPLAVIIEPTFSRSAGRDQEVLPGFEDEPRASTPFAKESAIIGAVCDEARRYGVRPGQKVAEATALVARLTVLTVTFAEIDRALGRVAEVALNFGTTAAIQLSVVGGRAQSPASQKARAPYGESQRPYGSSRAAQQSIAERSPAGDGPFDTVWLDITGAAHLRGGEDALLDALGERVSALGHNVHLAIADGPRIAQALARWGVSDKGHLIASEGRGADAMSSLPVRALPLPPDRIAFLLRVGVLTVGDLVRLPKAEALSRLGPRGAEALAVAAGFDPAPLVAFSLPPVLEEEISFDDGVQSVEPLLFVLRGATSRLSARLEARGEACTRLDIEMPYDASIARRVLAERGLLSEDDPSSDMPSGPDSDTRQSQRDRQLASRDVRQSVPRDVRQSVPRDVRQSVPRDVRQSVPRERFHVDLPAPLSAAADLFRVLRTRLERTTLIAPVTSVRVTISEIARARRAQLDFARDTQADPNSLPALLAELSAEIGPERVGVLALHDAIRPEARTRLVPVKDVEAPSSATSDPAPPSEKSQICPARLLKTPVSLGRAGSSVVAVTGQLYVVERRRFIGRLDDVEWWTDKPCSRDYFRTTLSSGAAYASARPGADVAPGTGPRAQSRNVTADALIFIDPRTEEAFLQGWFE